MARHQLDARDSPAKANVFIQLLVVAVFRFMTLGFVRRWLKSPGSIVFPFPGLCIKSTPFTGTSEADAMRFVSQNTAIPVPKVYCAFEHQKRAYIVMQRIKGQDLSFGWVQRSEESKSRILDELKSMMQQLRSLAPPSDIGVANVNGGAIYDQRLPKKSFWGPFATIHEFHRELRNGIEAENIQDDKATPGLKDLIAFHDESWPQPVFTHGDLSSLNVIAQGDKVVGIIDWETAAWMPPYWEYTSAWNVNPQNQFWQKEVDKFLDPMPRALEMEKIRRQYFGDI
ncbi:hypothetical protein FDECE_15396 [Fusarium decemcellulare]|nr:hypothetical protein FDECE_15396 [Fusarium decemcellulare]